MVKFHLVFAEVCGNCGEIERELVNFSKAGELSLPLTTKQHSLEREYGIVKRESEGDNEKRKKKTDGRR